MQNEGFTVRSTQPHDCSIHVSTGVMPFFHFLRLKGCFGQFFGGGGVVHVREIQSKKKKTKCLLFCPIGSWNCNQEQQINHSIFFISEWQNDPTVQFRRNWHHTEYRSETFQLPQLSSQCAANLVGDGLRDESIRAAATLLSVASTQDNSFTLAYVEVWFIDVRSCVVQLSNSRPVCSGPGCI